VRRLANGIDSALFDPAVVPPEPKLGAFAGPRLIFTGQMDYAPNIQACLRAARRILPAIRRRHPEASLHIVGRNPAPVLTALSGRDGVHVWGRVPEVQPWLAGADLSLVPLEIGRGVQNKVLEAMAMARPAVISAAAREGIDAENGRHLLVAQGYDMANAVSQLLADPARGDAMGQAARAHMIARYGWAAHLAMLDAMVGS